MICGVSRQKRTDFKQWLTIFCKLFKWNSFYQPNKESVFSIFADDYTKSLPIENDLNVILYKDSTRMLNPQFFFSFCVNIADMVKHFCISLLMLELDWILRCNSSNSIFGQMTEVVQNTIIIVLECYIYQNAFIISRNI